MTYPIEIDPDLNGFEGWMDKKLIFNGLESCRFHNHLALAITTDTPKTQTKQQLNN